MVAVPEQYGDIFLPWYGVATHLAIGVGSGLLVLAVIVPGSPASRPWPLRVLAKSDCGVGGDHLLRHLPLAFPGALADRARGPAPPGVRVRRLSIVLVWLAAVAAAVLLGAASFYLVEQPAQSLLRRHERRELDRASARLRPVLASVQLPGRPGLDDQAVQARLDGLNSSGVAADHLA